MNKTSTLVLTVITTVLCIYYLSFNLISYNVEQRADGFATETNDGFAQINTTTKRQYLDSVWNEVVYDFLGFAQYTYKDVKENGLSLGLDLQGGMHLTLEISPQDILLGLSGNNKDPNFRKALEQAQVAQENSQADYVDLFLTALGDIAPDRRLADFFTNSANRASINPKSPDEDVEKFIKAEVADAKSRAFNIIRTRVDKFGVSQPNIQLIAGTGRIQVELPGVSNPKRVKKLLQGVAKLEFLEVWKVQDIAPRLQELDQAWVKYQKTLAPPEDSTDTTSRPEDLNLLADDEELKLVDEDSTDSPQLVDQDTSSDSGTNAEDSLRQNYSPLFTQLASNQSFVYGEKAIADVEKVLEYGKDQNILPRDMDFCWSVKAVGKNDQTGEDFFELYAVKRYQSRRQSLTGEVITNARQEFDRNNAPSISMSMNAQGAKKWAKLTRENIGNQVAIVLDNYVYSAPVVNGEIPNGQSSITGSFTLEEAQDLANILKTGKLPAPTRIVEEAIVGPTLSLQSQRQGITSIIVGLLLIIVFMVVYYAKSGAVANAALFINIFFIMGLLANFNAALTLPGIAGIVLTIGMSIDANVLIFERIKEELKQTNNLKAAIAEGYKRAYRTIFDSNLTTAITAIILYLLGAGPVKGFAITLIIGIACSFFSAVFITRVMVEWFIKKDRKLSFDTFISKSILQKLNFNFLNKRKLAYVFSGLIILVGVSLMWMRGLNLGVDFEGGRSYVVEFKESLEPSAVRSSISESLSQASVEVKTFGAPNVLKVTTNYLVRDESQQADSLVAGQLQAALANFSGATYTENLAGELPDQYFRVLSTNKVGSTIADDIKNTSQLSIIFALIAIFTYIRIRFRYFQFGIGAVVALVHDTLIVLSLFAIADLLGIAFEIDQIFIAAILTVVGYSINDTVVVFDRVREELDSSRKNILSLSLLDISINKTLSRTLITSFTTLLVVVILLVFGGEILRGFSFALLVGIFFGTYSSIFIATPIVFETRNLKFFKRKG